jgi:Peptidase family M23
MLRTSVGLALLVLLGGQHAVAQAEEACEVLSLVAARAYVNCLTHVKSSAIRHDAEPDLARCDDRLERKLARAECGSAHDAAALGARLQAALAFEPGAQADEAHFTPVVMSVVAEPHPVTGSDARTHLVYEIHLTNASPVEWPIAAIEVLDGDDPERLLLAIEGDEVAAKVQSLTDRAALGALPRGHSALAFLHVPVEPDAGIPSNLVHRLTLSLPDSLPDTFLVFAGLPPDAEVLEEVGARTSVADQAPAVLGPPLQGDGWIAADGCCVAPRHVRGVQTVNGQTLGAQRFAIDWERLNEENRIFVGDPEDVESYFAYGQPVLAVADARVARVLDGLEEQVPGALPDVIALEEADGNHVVLDLGDGRFVLYAHMIPGSITVDEGDQVRRGDVLGLLGNSGNSSAPHLHLHVMSTASGLASNGLPYVIDSYELLGRIPSTAAFDEAEASGEPAEIVEVEIPGAHAGDLPLDRSIVRFPGG